MNIDKAMVKEITPTFGIKAVIELRDGLFQKQNLAFRGLDVPSRRSKKGQALYQHLMNVLKRVPFLAVKKYGNDSFLRHNTDFFYLPGENDLSQIVKRGRCLNQELLDLGLAQPYDENKRKIDFSKRSIKVKNKDIDLVTGNFKAEVCMYINDCKQYLRAAIEEKPVNMGKGEFDPTDEEFLIIYGLKEVKEMCMRLAGRRPLDWKGN